MSLKHGSPKPTTTPAPEVKATTAAGNVVQTAASVSMDIAGPVGAEITASEDLLAAFAPNLRGSAKSIASGASAVKDYEPGSEAGLRALDIKTSADGLTQVRAVDYPKGFLMTVKPSNREGLFKVDQNHPEPAREAKAPGVDQVTKPIGLDTSLSDLTRMDVGIPPAPNFRAAAHALPAAFRAQAQAPLASELAEVFPVAYGAPRVKEYEQEFDLPEPRRVYEMEGDGATEMSQVATGLSGEKAYDLSPRAMRDRNIAGAVKDEALRVTDRGRRFIEPLDLATILDRVPACEDPVMRDRSVGWKTKEAVQNALPGGWEYRLDTDRAALAAMDHLAILERLGN